MINVSLPLKCFNNLNSFNNKLGNSLSALFCTFKTRWFRRLKIGRKRMPELISQLITKVFVEQPCADLYFHLGSGIPLRTIISWQPRGGEMSHRWWRRIYTGSPCINPSPVRHLHRQENSIILFNSIIDVDLYMQLKETPCASDSEGKP